MRLFDFYEMPWCEYLIKCYAYERMQEDEWRKVRLIAYNARIGSHLDPKDRKSVPLRIEDFMPIGAKEVRGIIGRQRANKRSMELLKKEREAALKKRDEKLNAKAEEITKKVTILKRS